ncbi:MAG TPA: efflux RND transporter periplasmic adaptor subunit [Paraburkholderia sp.]
MPRKYLISAITATLVAVAIAFAALAPARDSSSREGTSGASGASGASGTSDASAAVHATSTATGRNGGTVLTSGRVAIEVLLSEKPGDARLVVYPFLDGKPAEKDVSVSGSLKRYDGTLQPMPFSGTPSRFASTDAIAKPHVFDATLSVTTQGQSASFAFSRADDAIDLNANQIRAAQIEIARAAPAQVVARVLLPGEIKLDEDRTAHVVPRVAGVIERVAVSIGQPVEKGQLLAVIASPDLADRRSELLAAQRRLVAARATYTREKSLWQERISAEQDYLQAQTQLREAEIATQNARQKLAALGALGALHAPPSSALNRYALRAPFAGTIVEKHVAPGESIAADTNIFVISDLTSVWAEMAVPAQRLNDVRVGREATVSATAFESNSSGRIAYVGALLGEQTRTAPARVVLSNPGGAWRPGMFVEVAVEAGKQDVPVAVRTDALHDIDGVPSVFVLSPKGFVAQPIEMGRRDAQVVEVVSGLTPGQQYAAANSFVLKAELGKGSVEGH